MLRLPGALILVLVWLSPLRAETPPIATPEVRDSALRAIFPGLEIAATTRHRDDSGRDQWMGQPDAFGRETVYLVNGPAANEEERCASEDMLKKRFSSTREVRFQVFAWPGVPQDALAVVQYSFIDSVPAGACWSIGLLAHLTRQGAGWEVAERRLLPGHRHSRISGARMVDVTGDAVDDLVVEPDAGGAGTWGTWMLVYDLKQRTLRPILNIPSRMEEATDNYFSEFLDLYGSRGKAGKAVCFRLTVWVKDGKIYPAPRVSFHCVPAGTGVDETEMETLDARLRPIQP